MSNMFIKDPDGRIIAAPRGVTVSKVVDGAPVTVINEKALKPGWSVATAACLDGLRAKQEAAAKAEAARLSAEELASVPAQLAALHAKLDALAAPKKKGE